MRTWKTILSFEEPGESSMLGCLVKRINPPTSSPNVYGVVVGITTQKNPTLSNQVMLWAVWSASREKAIAAFNALPRDKDIVLWVSNRDIEVIEYVGQKDIGLVGMNHYSEFPVLASM